MRSGTLLMRSGMFFMRSGTCLCVLGHYINLYGSMAGFDAWNVFVWTFEGFKQITQKHIYIGRYL